MQNLFAELLIPEASTVGSCTSSQLSLSASAFLLTVLLNPLTLTSNPQRSHALKGHRVSCGKKLLHLGAITHLGRAWPCDPFWKAALQHTVHNSSTDHAHVRAAARPFTAVTWLLSFDLGSWNKELNPVLKAAWYCKQPSRKSSRILKFDRLTRLQVHVLLQGVPLWVPTTTQSPRAMG